MYNLITIALIFYVYGNPFVLQSISGSSNRLTSGFHGERYNQLVYLQVKTNGVLYWEQRFIIYVHLTVQWMRYIFEKRSNLLL